MSYEFKFPDIGEGLTEGKILELRVQPGTEVTAGDILAIVETDKVVAEIASPRSGIVEAFGSAVGEHVKVGETLAYIDLAAGSGAAGDGGSTTNGGRQLQVLVGTLDAAPSTLPASDELPAQDSTRPLPDAEDDQSRRIGIAPGPAFSGQGSSAAHGLASTAERAAEREPPGPVDGAARTSQQDESAPSLRDTEGNRDRHTGTTGSELSGQDLRVTPAARRLARDLGVDLRQVRPGRAGGHILRGDVERAASATRTAAPPVPARPPERSDFAFPLIDDPLVTPADLPLGQTVELTILRKTIAHTMESSRKIPAATIFDLGIVDDLVELRAKVNQGRDVRVSFQPFFMKALATALRRYPVLNAHFNPVSEELTVFKDVNIGLAVNTEAGLMVPVIHNVENKTIRQIDTEMKDMVGRAKGRQISITELRGGTFSLTNFGPFGGLFACPMIYPPQVAILGAGRIHQAPMVVDGVVRAAWVLPVSLAFDHRVVDGVPAAEFSSYFLELLRAPQELFVSM